MAAFCSTLPPSCKVTLHWVPLALIVGRLTTNKLHKRGQTCAAVRMLQAQEGYAPVRCAAQGYGAQQGFLLLHTVPGFPMAPPHHRAGTSHTFPTHSTHDSRIHAHPLLCLSELVHCSRCTVNLSCSCLSKAALAIVAALLQLVQH